MGYWINLVNFVSDTALHDELNEVIQLKEMCNLIYSLLYNVKFLDK